MVDSSTTSFGNAWSWCKSVGVTFEMERYGKARKPWELDEAIFRGAESSLHWAKTPPSAGSGCSVAIVRSWVVCHGTTWAVLAAFFLANHSHNNTALTPGELSRSCSTASYCAAFVLDQSAALCSMALHASYCTWLFIWDVS